MKLILYHGTSEENAKQIEKEGFKTDRPHNWQIIGKAGFVYLSSAYAPFYCMKTNSKRLALIKCEVRSSNCYPEDDFLMFALGKPKYTQEELDKVSLKKYKPLWDKSLQYMGNVAVKPQHINIIGIRYFEGTNLLLKCDPVISPTNFKIMGYYYKKLSDWIYDGKEVMDFKGFMEDEINELKARNRRA